MSMCLAHVVYLLNDLSEISQFNALRASLDLINTTDKRTKFKWYLPRDERQRVLATTGLEYVAKRSVLDLN
jgi:hypothetical protein